ncbi:hypothetical protein I7I48_00934 [Histoplasma ohiense]|nr:hypothetical protein I7I48_00934 [Histoplasma ohiense (nom. inval.)]
MTSPVVPTLEVPKDDKDVGLATGFCGENGRCKLQFHVQGGDRAHGYPSLSRFLFFFSVGSFSYFRSLPDGGMKRVLLLCCEV